MQISTENFSAIIVDDDPVCIEQLKDLLLDHHNIEIISTHTKTSGVLRTIKKHKPEIVFLDIEMPGISGLDLGGLIREYNSAIHVIFITAYHQYAIQAIKKSAFDFLLKPVDPDELTETLLRLSNEKGPFRNLLDHLQMEFSLSNREIEIIEQISLGNTSKGIADKLSISRLTVNTHRQNILRKTKCSNFSELLRKAKVLS